MTHDPSSPSHSTALPTVRVVPLRWWLPLALVFTCVLAFALLVLQQQRHYTLDLQRFSDRTAHAELLGTQRNLETVLRREDGSGLDGVIAELGLNPAVAHALLLDASDEVLAATRFAWRGSLGTQVLPHYPQDLVSKARQEQREQLRLDIEQRHLWAVTPVMLALEAGAIRSSRQGVLLVEYDLTPIAAQSSAHIRQQAQVFAAVVLLAAMCLLMLARWGVMRPVNALRASMARIGAGDFTAVPALRGEGEFQELGQALGHMAQELQHSSQALRESEARFRQLSDVAFEAIFLHSGGHIVDANAAAERLMGVAPGGLRGTDMLSWVAPGSRDAIRQRIALRVEGTWGVDMVDAQGQLIAAEASVRQRELDGNVLRVVAVRDIRERLAAEAQIRQLAHFDALTGLHNRRFLLEQVAAELARPPIDGQPRRAALATLNLNAFQAVNDSLGMAAGDAALRIVAQRLSSLLTVGQSLARVDGDTFALLITDLHGDLQAASAQAARAIEQLLAAVAEPLEVRGQALHLSAGAGVVMIPNDSRDPPELLREAETAMHRAKEAGDTQVQFFAHALQEAASERLALRNDLRQTLRLPPQAQQLLLHYQPQVDAAGSLLGVEALVRWQHPTRGMIPPGAFIAEAESCGLIVPLGHWVLHEAVACLRRWQQQADGAPWASQLTMAVNVSPRQFRESDFISRIEDVLAQVGVSALSLELELTESVVADDLEATLEKMALLRSRGVRFALDDFGTGYSSLAYLKRLPIDTLKIDRSFVMDIDAPIQSGPGKRPAVLIDAIIAMAHQLEMRVLAEGVETATQRERLVRAGCDIFQGYYFSRPLSEANLQAWASQSHQGG